MLKKVSIAHYKSLAEVNLILEKANVIVGANGSGKSNLIDCLNFVRDCCNEDLDSATTKRHGAESVRQWSKFKPYDVNIEMGFESSRGQGGYKVALASAGGSFKVKEESGYWVDPKPEDQSEERRSARFARSASGRVELRADMLPDRIGRLPTVPPFDLFATQLSGGVRSIYSVAFRNLISELSELSTYSIYPNTIRLPQVVSRESLLADDGSNLASVLKKLNSGQKRSKDRMIEALQTVLPIVNDIIIRSAGGYYVPVMRVKEPNGDLHDFNMSQISDGTLRMLGLLAAFYQVGAPSKIALEEPEQMIHPGLLPVLKDAADDYLQSKRDSQYFMTTHSPNFLNLFDPRQIIWLSYDAGVSRASRLGHRKLELIKSQLFSPGEILLREGVGLLSVWRW